MGNYRNNPDAVRALVRENEVHRDLFISQEIFELEMEHLYSHTWVYVSHDSLITRRERLRHYHGGRPVRHHGAAQRIERAGALQPLPAQRHHAGGRRLRQHR